MTGLENVTYFGVWMGTLVFGTLIGAASLQIAISIYNSLAGGESSPGVVVMPSFGQATKIFLGTALLFLLAGKIIAVVAPESMNLSRPKREHSYNSYRAANPPPPQKPDPLRRAAKSYFWFVVGFLVVAEMLAGMLSTTLVRASVVTACFLIISNIPFAVLLVIRSAVMVATK